MDFHLQNVRTGETVKLSPDRTLIGTADHAEIRTAEGGPYLAALAVRTPAGWSLFALSDDDAVTFNRRPFGVGQRAALKKGDLLVIGDERFTFLAPGDAPPAPDADPPPACFAFVHNPDGMEECRAVDHDLLIGRLPVCHVQLADARLSRLSALLATHGGTWYVHTLSKKVIGRNRKAVDYLAALEDGDELMVGPLVIRLELRPATAETPALTPPALPAVRPRRPIPAALAGPTDFDESTDDGVKEQLRGPDLTAVRAGAQRLEQWLKNREVVPPPAKSGLGGWFDVQRDRFLRFWYDTPETTTARSLRAAGQYDEAFALLDRAIRARPDGPELLRELYRLYEAVEFFDLCYRPLRHIEKLADARGTPDTWVLETLAKVCERMSAKRPSMADRAINYLNKLEAATGVSRTRQKADMMARRTLREGGYAGRDSE